MGLELRRHPADFYHEDLQTGERSGPLDPSDPRYPPAFKLHRAIYLDGVFIGLCVLKPGAPINLMRSRVLPLPSESQKAQIRDFVQSHFPDGSLGAVVDAPPLVDDERNVEAEPDDEPTDDEDFEGEDDE